MTALSPGTAARVAKLAPVLSSDKVGEVAAAAAAIGRALKAGGSDWHDLGDAIERSAERVTLPSQQQERLGYVTLDPAQRAAVLVALRRGLGSPRLSAWEHSFTSSILGRLEDAHARVSRRQAEAVDRILIKLAGTRR